MQVRTQNVLQVQTGQTFFPGMACQITNGDITLPLPCLRLNAAITCFSMQNRAHVKILPLIYCLKTLHGTQPRDWQLTLGEELIVWFVYQWSFEWKWESNKMSSSAQGDWLIGWPVTPNVYTSRFVGANQAGVNYSLVCLQNLSNIVWI